MNKVMMKILHGYAQLKFCGVCKVTEVLRHFSLSI